MNRLITALLAIGLAAAAGCGTNNENNTSTNNETNNTTSNNETNNTSSNNDNNTTSNNENNTTANNDNNTSPNNTTGNNNPRTEPYVTQFRFYEETQSALGATKEGFTVGVVGMTIENEDGNQKAITEMDVEMFESTHLTMATIDSMKNGWGCREVTTGDDMGSGGADMGADMGSTDAGTGPIEEATYWFEARVQEDGNTRYIEEITGCVLDEDPAVMPIIESINELGESYL